MTDKWETIVEDEALADPLIIPATGPLDDGESGADEARAEEACDREDALLAKDAERDLATDRAPRRRVGRASRVSSPRARHIADG